MSIEKFLQFQTQYNTLIIEVLIALTGLLALFLAIRYYVQAKNEVTGAGGASLSELETALKKILEKANQVPSLSGAVPSAGGDGDSGKLANEILGLKQELEQKKLQIEELKNNWEKATDAGGAAAAGAGAISKEDQSKLEAQIKELQGKLSEYEIISEDIADLSFYKDQNQKLQRELDALKAGGAIPAAAPVAPAEPAAPPAPVKAEPAIVGSAKATPPAEVEETEVASNSVDEDLLADFNAAAAKTEPTAAPPEKAAPVAAEEAEPAGVDLGSMDMDKMMAEASGITDDNIPEVSIEDALGKEPDSNKLLAEADALGANPNEADLMGEFENFVKKGS